ncbi:transcriptional adapter 3-like isoform X1 [Varroa jacobsoni]|nr:transcriptional adapter 3-like isoform X1 [Varroa jacobsoni]
MCTPEVYAAIAVLCSIHIYSFANNCVKYQLKRRDQMVDISDQSKFTITTERQNRYSNFTLSLEDIDPLQLELETLLVAVVQRKQQLRAQLEALDHDDSTGSREGNRTERDRGDKQRASSPLQGGSMSKRSRGADHKSNKKGSKDKSSKAVSGHDATGENINQESGSTPAPKIPKSGPKVPGGQCQGNKAGQGPLPANDAPHRFWAYLNNYCQAANDDQVEGLENMLEAQEAIKFSEYVKVPPLGTHYIVKWAQEDLLEEQMEATPEASTVNFMEDMEKVLHQTAKESLSDERYGTLTQRLMSCLLEENGIVPPGEEMPFVVAQGRTTSAPNAASIEQRIRRELEELGVMQALAEKVAEQDDEVFLELRKCQSQLLSISAQNVRMLRALLEKARRRRAEYELEERLRAIDQEMLDQFRRRKATARSSRTSSLILLPPTKQDKEQMRALLDERKSILARLDPMKIVTVKTEPL